MKNLSIGFHGAAGTVTGSKYLLYSAERRVLVDCGMFQGVEALDERNRQPLPFAPAALDAVVLTHAHLDHCGLLPVLHRDGFIGPVYCTAATAALAGILLPDSGRIHEEDARRASRRDRAPDDPTVPLFTEDEAQRCLELLKPTPFGDCREICPGVTARFRRAGHILGAAWLEVETLDRRLAFSGDLGRAEDPIMHAPEPLEAVDYLVVESTYGDRSHDTTSPQAVLAEVIRRTVDRHGLIIVPAFAVGRAQQVLYYLWQLLKRSEIPQVPIFLDSPMTASASEVFCNHPQDHRLSQQHARRICAIAHRIATVEESRALNRLRSPAIIISASGMASGGRVLHHLKAHIGEPANTILFTGYQAEGTRGAGILAGDESVEIHGEHYPVRAEICEIPGLSAHADAGEIVQWVSAPLQAPRRTFVTHGEPAASAALCERLRRELGWVADVPELDERAVLD